MVTPENGTLVLKGTSGREYAINLYSSDVLAANVTMSLTGLAGAGSQTFYIIPEDCVVKDISVHTGQTVATVWVPYVNDVPVGAVIPFAAILDTLAYRSFPQLKISGGRKFTIQQA